MPKSCSPLALNISRQPDDSTCGPTALQAVYRYFGFELPLKQMLGEISSFEDGGTLAVTLGTHALRSGFNAELVSYNLKIFDPTWAGLESKALIDKLHQQVAHKDGKKFKIANLAYIQFLEAGGEILFQDLSLALLDRYFDRGLPVLVGLSATYLYPAMREFVKSSSRTVDDDVRGEPVGHFVVLCGRDGDQVYVADPYEDNPRSQERYYRVQSNHLFHSILLGIITYDANLLAIWPGSSEANEKAGSR